MLFNILNIAFEDYFVIFTDFQKFSFVDATKEHHLILRSLRRYVTKVQTELENLISINS